MSEYSIRKIDSSAGITDVRYVEYTTILVPKSGGTFTGNVISPAFSATTYSGVTFYGDGTNLTGIASVSEFDGHTGDTSIHYTKGSINLSELGSSAHTHPISEIVDLQTELDSKVNTFSTGGTYNQSTDIITITNSTGGTFDITGVSDTFITGQTFNTGDYKLTTVLNDATSFVSDLSILSSDMVVTGGTYDIDTGVVTFTNNSGNTFEVSGFTTGMTDSYTTSATLNGEVIEFGNNIQGANYYNVDLNPVLSGKVETSLFDTYTGDTATELASKALQTDFVTHSGDTSIHFTKDSLNSIFVNKSGDTMTGNLIVPVLSATTVSGDTFYGDGSNLTGIGSTGVTATIQVGENVSSGDLLYLNTDGKYWKADNSGELSASTELRLANATILADASGEAIIQDRYTTTGLSSGTTYWVGTGGTFTNTQPTSNGSIVRYIGTAVSDTVLDFNPDALYVEVTNQGEVYAPTAPSIRTLSGNTTVLATDYTINIPVTGDTIQTLPTAVGIAGKVYNIKNSDNTNTSTITIDTNGTELIDNLYGNGTSLEIIFPQSITVQSTGTGWIII